jgi:16S rRNA (adenine1518-N6/adenine1519-N6)-dimethyltransferase
MLRSALAARYAPAAVQAALAAAGLDPTARGETLTIADFARLAGHL